MDLICGLSSRVEDIGSPHYRGPGPVPLYIYICIFFQAIHIWTPTMDSVAGVVNIPHLPSSTSQYGKFYGYGYGLWVALPLATI